MPLRSIAFLAYFLGSSALSLAVPMIGVICYVVLYHVYPQTTWWGAPLQFLGIRYSYVCGLCLGIGTILNLNRLQFGRRFVHPLEWMALILFLTMLLSSATGLYWSERTEFVLDKMSKVFLFTFMMSHVVVSRHRLWQLTLLFTVMALYLGHEARTAPPSAFTSNRLDGIGGPDFRESAGLAIHLFALMPFVAIVFRQKKLWLKILAFLAAGYGMNAILLCRARSAFLAGIIAGVLAIWYIPRRHRCWVILVLVLASAGGIILSDNWFWERMLTILSSSEERDRSASSRLVLWQAAWEMIRDYPLGVGIGHFRDVVGDYVDDPTLANRDAHNSFVLCATETGIPGLITYVATLAIAWHTLSKLNRRIRSRLANTDFLELMVFANRLALLVYAIAGLFVSRFYTEGAWWFIMLPVCLERVVEAEIRAEAREELILRNKLEQACSLQPSAWPAV
ncbi:MAG TPA: O-antigen ligase family protein [Phycisphaerae bacterium]|nr:O-antigen ligase family protein [Phycisphaerae bacterium]